MKPIVFCALLLCASTLCLAQSRSLFNGKDLSGWHMDVPDLEKDSSLRIPFIVRDGLLVSLGTRRGT